MEQRRGETMALIPRTDRRVYRKRKKENPRNLEETSKVVKVDAELSKERVIDSGTYLLMRYRTEEEELEEMEIQREIVNIRARWIEVFMNSADPEDDPENPFLDRLLDEEHICGDYCMRNHWLVPVFRVEEDKPLNLFGCIKHGGLHRCHLPGQCYSQYVNKIGETKCCYSHYRVILLDDQFNVAPRSAATNHFHHDNMDKPPNHTYFLSGDRPPTTQNLYLAREKARLKSEADKKVEQKSTRNAARGQMNRDELKVSARKRQQYNLTGLPRTRTVSHAQRIIETIVMNLASAKQPRREIVNILRQRCLRKAVQAATDLAEQWAHAGAVGQPVIWMPDLLQMTHVMLEETRCLSRYHPVFEFDDDGELDFRLTGAISLEEGSMNEHLHELSNILYYMWRQFETLDLHIASTPSLVNFVVFAVLTLGSEDLWFAGEVIIETTPFYMTWLPTPEWQTLLKKFHSVNKDIANSSFSSGSRCFMDCMSELESKGMKVSLEDPELKCFGAQEDFGSDENGCEEGEKEAVQYF